MTWNGNNHRSDFCQRAPLTTSGATRGETMPHEQTKSEGPPFWSRKMSTKDRAGFVHVKDNGTVSYVNTTGVGDQSTD